MTNDCHARRSSAPRACRCAASPPAITGWVKAVQDQLLSPRSRKRPRGAGAAAQEWPVWSVW